MDQMRDPVRDDARLAAARAGEDQQRALDVSGSFVLLGVQTLKEIHRRDVRGTPISVTFAGS